MNRLTSVLTMSMVAIVASVGMVAPVSAAQGVQWSPAPRTTHDTLAHVVNADAIKNGGPEHSYGCFQVLLLKGHKDIAAVSLKSKANTQACGNAREFGIQAFKKTGSTWAHVAGTPGPAGSACTYDKTATAAVKALLKRSGLCA
jgi:hypothetical protein